MQLFRLVPYQRTFARLRWLGRQVQGLSVQGDARSTMTRPGSGYRSSSPGLLAPTSARWTTWAPRYWIGAVSAAA
jgi:hypothetical protein